MGSMVVELEGTTQGEARDAWANREGITWWPDALEEGITWVGGLTPSAQRSRRHSVQHRDPPTLARVRTLARTSSIEPAFEL